MQVNGVQSGDGLSQDLRTDRGEIVLTDIEIIEREARAVCDGAEDVLDLVRREVRPTDIDLFEPDHGLRQSV